MNYVALSVGCRENNSLRCADGMCLPPTVTCDGVQYCRDGSTFDVLCGKFVLRLCLWVPVRRIIKFADDTTLVVPEKTDVSLPEEFDHINVWATVNRMILNLVKTKEIVFHHPGPKKLHMFPSVESIELVEQAKLLGVILQNNFSVNSHVNLSLIHISEPTRPY